MYCEIVAKHRKPLSWDDLRKAIGERLGKEISLDSAYQSSALYRRFPPRSSLLAFDSVLNCFVIIRSVNYDSCTYHLEGNDPSVSVSTLLEAAGVLSNQLFGIFHSSNQEGPNLTIRLFEDNGRETSVEGKPITLNSILKDKFAWKELKSSAIPFVTTLLLIWLGLEKGPVTASIYSFVIVLVFALGDVFFSHRVGRGKIEWQLRQS